MSPDDPRHGKYAGYMAGCRCADCVTSRRRYDKQTAMRRMRGPLTVPVDKAVAHIERCFRFGVTGETFQRESNVHHAVRIAAGERQAIHARTEARILKVQPLPGVNCWPAYAVCRKLRALIALGHSQAALGERLSKSPGYVSMVVTNLRECTHYDPEFWVAVDNLYRELCMTPGTSVRSLRRGAKNNWPTPLAWDDIDDPDEEPTAQTYERDRDIDEAVILRNMAGDRVPATHAERIEIVVRMLDLGYSHKHIEAKTGISKVDRYVKEAKEVAA
jgi:hypothetical protein